MRVIVAIDSSSSSQRVLEESAIRPWCAHAVFCVMSVVDVSPFCEVIRN